MTPPALQIATRTCPICQEPMKPTTATPTSATTGAQRPLTIFHCTACTWWQTA
jgi:RNase P subunit RPR2